MASVAAGRAAAIFLWLLGIQELILGFPNLTLILNDLDRMPDPTTHNLFLSLAIPVIALGLGIFAWAFPEKIFKPELTDEIKEPRELLRVVLIILGSALALTNCWLPLRALVFLGDNERTLQVVPYLISLVPTAVGILVAASAGRLADALLRKTR